MVLILLYLKRYIVTFVYHIRTIRDFVRIFRNRIGGSAPSIRIARKRLSTEPKENRRTRFILNGLLCGLDTPRWIDCCRWQQLDEMALTRAYG